MAELKAPERIVTLPTVGEVTVTASPGVANWKTVAYAVGGAAALAALNSLTSIDWTQYVSPNVAVFVSLAITLVLRWFTSGPIGSNVTVKKD